MRTEPAEEVRIMQELRDLLGRQLEERSAEEQRLTRMVKTSLCLVAGNTWDKRSEAPDLFKKGATSTFVPTDRRAYLSDVGREIADAMGEVPLDSARFARRLRVTKLWPDPTGVLSYGSFYEASVQVAHVGATWAKQGSNVFSLSDGLAVKLALTDSASAGEVHLPFDALVVLVPPGVVPFAVPDSSDAWRWASEVWVHRLEREGKERLRLFVGWRGIGVVRDVAPFGSGEYIEPFGAPDAEGKYPLKEDDAAFEAAERLVRNLCLWLEATGGAKVHGPRLPPLPPSGKAPQKRWDLGRDVKITTDLRNAAAEMALGRSRRPVSGWKVRCRFVVRGHWRNQAHGPGRELRTRKWIEPFWKGPEGAEAWAHVYRLDDKEK